MNRRASKASRKLGELVRVGHVARVLGWDIKTVRKYVKNGTLRGKKVGGRLYVERSAFEALRDSRAEPSLTRE